MARAGVHRTVAKMSVSHRPGGRPRSGPISSVRLGPAESDCLRLFTGTWRERRSCRCARACAPSRRRRPAHRGAGTPPAPPPRDRREARQPRWRRRGWVCSACPGRRWAGIPEPECPRRRHGLWVRGGGSERSERCGGSSGERPRWTCDINGRSCSARRRLEGRAAPVCRFTPPAPADAGACAASRPSAAGAADWRGDPDCAIQSSFAG